MSDKPKTIKEALELVKQNVANLNEQEATPEQRRAIQMYPVPSSVKRRVRETGQLPARDPEKQERLEKAGEIGLNVASIAPAVGAARAALGSRIAAGRAAPSAAPSAAPAALPKPAATGASSGTSTAPAARPAAPGGSATPPPRTVGSSSTAGPGYTPTGGVSGARTNRPSGSGITPGKVAAGLAGAGAVGGAAYVASRASGEKAEASPKKVDTDAAFAASDPKPDEKTANKAALNLATPPATRPAAPAPAARPETPRPAARPTAPAPRPAAPAADPNATSRAMFQAAQDRESRGESGGGAAFFAADQQRMRELRSQKTNEENKMSSPMIQAFLKLHNKESYDNMFNEAKKHKKHLDPVGKEDEDIDNDGDSDKSDQYLHNRRKAIGKAIKESGDEGTAGAVKKDGKDVVSPTAPGGSGYKKEGPSDKEREALNKKIDKIVKEDSLGSIRGTYDRANAARRDKEPGVIQYSGPAMTMRNAGIMNAPRKSEEKPAEKEPAGKITDRVPSDKPYGDLEGAKKAMGNKANEEVEFSESELAHIAAIMEISVPASPVADDYTGSNHGVSKRDLSDETMSEEEAVKRGRGRPAGKYGAYKRKDTAGADGEEEKAEPKNLVAQNPRTYNKDGKNMVDLEHPSKPGVKRTVPAKHYDDFRSSYLNAEKPAEKQKMHDNMVSRVFGKS